MCNLEPASRVPMHSLSFFAPFPSLVVQGVHLLNSLFILDTVDVLVGAKHKKNDRSQM